MTIQERAKKFADNYCVGDASIIVDLVRKVAEEAYIAGATEQHDIDINKLKDVMNALMINTYVKAEIIKLINE